MRIQAFALYILQTIYGGGDLNKIKIERIISCVIVLLFSVSITATNIIEIRNGQAGPTTSSMMFEKDKEKINSIIDEASSFDDLISNIIPNYVVENVMYNDGGDNNPIIQNYSFKKFMNKNGVCFQISHFAKQLVLEYAKKNKIEKEVKAYSVDVYKDYFYKNTKWKHPHTYNVFIYKGKTYLCDYTFYLSSFQDGKNYRIWIITTDDKDIFNEYFIYDKLMAIR